MSARWTEFGVRLLRRTVSVRKALSRAQSKRWTICERKMNNLFGVPRDLSKRMVNKSQSEVSSRWTICERYVNARFIWSASVVILTLCLVGNQKKIITNKLHLFIVISINIILLYYRTERQVNAKRTVSARWTFCGRRVSARLALYER